MQAARLETLSAELEEVQARQASLREEVLEARRLDERARQREQELARLVAAAEARASGADARAAADRARLERLEQEREELLFEISRLEEQGDLFAEQLRGLAADRARLEDERDAATEHLAVARNAEAEARRAFNEAEDRANLLASQLAALEALEREHHGFHPAVAAALAAKDRLDGLLGPLSEFLDLPPDRAAAVEHALGSILQLLVVRDAAAAERVRQWIEGQEGGAGGDTTDQGDPSGQGTTRDESGGEGAVAIILEAAVPRVRALVEEIVFAGEPADGPVLLGRRQRLDELRAASARAREERDARASAREEAAEQLAIAEETLRVRESTLQDLDLELRRAEADEQTWSGQNTRLERTREELDRRLAELRVAAEKARAEASAGREERSRLADELERHREEWQAAGNAHADREAAWEAVRDEEAELRVLHARAESAVAELDRRLAAARGGIDAAQRRLQALDREEGENRASLEQLATIRSEAGAQLEDLFQRRAELAAELRTMDEALEVSNQAAQELEARVRELRRAGQERGEERHRLELRRAEAQAAVRSARERLEAEWARPFDQPSQADRIEGDADTLRAELQAIAADIERLGPVNMLAVEEHEEESQRLEFLTTQRDDLVRARDDLQTAIRQINRTARTLFLETFEQVRENFARTFTTLFEGGTCDLRLSDPEDPLESDVEISASPGGKRTQRIHLLSGGERALTSLALLFAVYLVKPSPFCVLDEVDAP